MTDDDRLDVYLAQCATIIAEHGCMIQGVFGGREGPEDFLPFAYTVGLTELDAPEIVMVGLSIDMMTELLNLLAERARMGVSVEAGTEHDILANNLAIRLVETDTEGFGTAIAFYHPRLRTVWAQWPDPQGRFPGDEGYDATRYRQVRTP